MVSWLLDSHRPRTLGIILAYQWCLNVGGGIHILNSIIDAILAITVSSRILLLEIFLILRIGIILWVL